MSTRPCHETRLAILEDDCLVELYIEQEFQHALAGSIFKGRVTRVLPGMQSAFVDIGLERDAFLYVSDFLDDNEDLETPPADATPRRSEGSSEDEPAEPNAEAGSTDRLAHEGAAAEPPAPEEKVSTEGNLGRRGGRGRRSRRRGGRSGEGSAAGPKSGFPEEKYAPIDGDEQPKDTEPADGDDPAAGQESGFVVLPGESLAKYTARQRPRSLHRTTTRRGSRGRATTMSRPRLSRTACPTTIRIATSTSSPRVSKRPIPRPKPRPARASTCLRKISQPKSCLRR